MARKQTALDNIVLPTRKMTSEQLAEQIHFARRAKKAAVKNRDSARGGRKGSRRAAIASFA
jgi:hypothetical protein